MDRTEPLPFHGPLLCLAVWTEAGEKEGSVVLSFTSTGQHRVVLRKGRSFLVIGDIDGILIASLTLFAKYHTITNVQGHIAPAPMSKPTWRATP